MIDIRQLQSLLALAETGNLSRASRRMNLSQPAISHQMKTLEIEVGSRIFERKSVPLKLTPAGRRLLELAREIDTSINRTLREISQLTQGKSGELRIAVECHSCFDWLMPTMDQFRESWPEVELDIVSGFHSDPVELLTESKAELVIVSQARPRPGVSYEPLFRYEIFGLVAKTHRLAGKGYLTARDFAKETLVTYPVPDERLDLVREVLRPAGVNPLRRTTELTVAILQLVASRRGIAALPGWTVQPYIERGYVIDKRIGKRGLYGRLYAAIPTKLAGVNYLTEFIKLMRKTSLEMFQHVYQLR